MERKCKGIKEYHRKDGSPESEEIIEAHDLPIEITRPSGENALPFDKDKLLTLEEMERYYIEMALDKTGGNKSRAAKLLGVTRQRLKRKLNSNDVIAAVKDFEPIPE